MQTAAHAMPPPGRAQRRATGLFFAILLQVGLIAALVVGLDIKVLPAKDHITEAFIEKKVVTVKPPPFNPIEPIGVFVPQPTFPVQPEAGDRERAITPTDNTVHEPVGIFDHGPVSVAPTHTVPPYPALYARLGSQGTVVLRLAISAQGVVTDAVVIRSSGTEGLDQVARAWVMAHWRYRPAIRGGAAVPGTTTVAVEFNLKNAG